MFWVLPEARWVHLQSNINVPENKFFDMTVLRKRKGDIGGLVDDAIDLANPNVLKDVSPKSYARWKFGAPVQSNAHVVLRQCILRSSYYGWFGWNFSSMFAVGRFILDLWRWPWRGVGYD